MIFSLHHNGIDSLKAAHDCLEKIDELEDGKLHRIKDAVIFLNHGLEILFKVILKQRSAALMFSDIKEYQRAKEEMKKSGKTDVFDVKPNLKTVSLVEAINRLEYLCDIEVPDSLKGTILYINMIRNKLMHYSVDMDDDGVDEFVLKLKYCYVASMDFLEMHFEEIKEEMHYCRFELTIEEYLVEQSEMAAMMRYEEEQELRENDYF